jgi:hypothetical protein
MSVMFRCSLIQPLSKLLANTSSVDRKCPLSTLLSAVILSFFQSMGPEMYVCTLRINSKLYFEGMVSADILGDEVGHMIWACVTTAVCRKDLVIIEKALSVALLLVSHSAAVDYLRTKVANECVLQALMQLALVDHHANDTPAEAVLLLSQACDKLLRIILHLLIKDPTQFADAVVSQTHNSNDVDALANETQSTTVDIIMNVRSTLLHLLYSCVNLIASRVDLANCAKRSLLGPGTHAC